MSTDIGLYIHQVLAGHAPTPRSGKDEDTIFVFAFEYDGEKLPDEAQPQIPKHDFRGVTASSLLFSLYKVQH